jgi:diaminopimelate epimerase
LIVSFEKWQGLGNDFVLVDAQAWNDAGAGPETAKRVCDRHFGVGADGVLLVERAGTDTRMIVINSDGSRPEMCGNGLRCVAAQCGQGMWQVETDAGSFSCSVTGSQVRVPMGRVLVGEDVVAVSGDRSFSLRRASIGNPHAITLTDDDVVSLCAAHGPALTVDEAFPDGANIEFVRVLGPTHIRVAVWERGAGPTLACGTGACATVATLVHMGLCSADTDITVSLPGGDLTIRAGRDGTTQMQGPAQRVFRGELDL